MQEEQSSQLKFIEAFKNSGLSGKISLILATWFGVGLIPGAPGTFGSLAAIPFFIVISYAGSIYTGLSLIVLFSVAVWTSDISRKLLKKNDPSMVVIDEVAGLFVAVFLLPVSIKSVLLGFLLFRIFDILKPYPIRLIDRKMKTGLGIVLDDIVAGIFSNICLRLIMLFL